MNEFKSLTDEQVEQMYEKARYAVITMSRAMPPNDRAYLVQRQRKLREEYIKRTNGQ
jgi:hypothetical protein